MPKKGDVKPKTWKGYNKDIPKSQTANARRYKRWKKKDPARFLLTAARARAKKVGLKFTLAKEDIVIPEICPVLGIPLVVSEKRTDNTPSVDRIDNTKGYIAGNVVVVSWRANMLKKDATIEELEKIVKFYKRESYVGDK